MFKKILFISALVIATMVPWDQVVEARILGGGCLRCASLQGLCAWADLQGIGNCDKEDYACCSMEYEVTAHSLLLYCCNHGEQCGGLGEAFLRADFNVGARDIFSEATYTGKGKGTSTWKWFECELFDQAFCKDVDSDGRGDVALGCYREDSPDTYLYSSPDANGTCPDGYTPYHYCPAEVGYDPGQLDDVQCQNDNWSVEPPPCPGVGASPDNPKEPGENNLFPLGSLDNEGYATIGDMTVCYSEWNYDDKDGVGCETARPDCPTDSFCRYYWLVDRSDPNSPYAYNSDYDQELLCNVEDGEPANKCDDGKDNDRDGLIDCDDPDCAGIGGCTSGVETACSDRIDNDREGGVDCADNTNCSPSFLGSETICDDSLDNDCDGAIDCADSDCPTSGTETVCDDGRDNDCDGLIDCADSTDCPAGGTESECNDGKDNDCDGAIDCADPDCALSCP